MPRVQLLKACQRNVLAVIQHLQAAHEPLFGLLPLCEVVRKPDLGRDGVLEAPLKAAEVNGGLYAAFGAVSVDTLVLA